MAKYFTKTKRSVPLLFDQGVQIFNSADKAELLAHHFELIHHLNLDVGTANHARIFNRTVGKFLNRPISAPMKPISQVPLNSDI
jgi:hypothetical protein